MTSLSNLECPCCGGPNEGSAHHPYCKESCRYAYQEKVDEYLNAVKKERIEPSANARTVADYREYFPAFGRGWGRDR